MFPAFGQETVPTPVTPAFSAIFISSEMNIISFEWKDIGLEKETQFTAPLMKSWEKWLKEHLPKNVGDAKICDASCLIYQSQWEEKLPEEISVSGDPAYQNSLWLKISLYLRRSIRNNIQSYQWDGRVHLLDGNTKRSITNMTLPKEMKEWLNTPQKDVNSGLVTRIYKTPLGAFPGLVQKIESSMPLNRVIKLVITGHKHLGDVTKLVELIQSRGDSMNLQVEMSQFASKGAEMKVYFRGAEKSFTDLLSQVKELKSSYNYSLVNEVTPSGHVIKLVKE
jgi:hypothetical protein